MGTFVKGEDTLKLTNNLPGLSSTPEMISTKCLEFFTKESVDPARGYELGNVLE